MHIAHCMSRLTASYLFLIQVASQSEMSSEHRVNSDRIMATKLLVSMMFPSTLC
jgi:hypothetical protein